MWRWVLLVVFGLLALLCFIRVGAYAAFGSEGLRLDVTVGFLRLRILPVKKKKKRKPAKKKKEKKPAEEKKKGPRPSITAEDIKDALRTLLPALGRMLRRFWRGIRFRPLRLSLVLGGRKDPAASAQLYGQLQSVIWTGMPILEKLVDIQKPYIHASVDFETEKTAAEGEVGVTLRIGTLLAMVFGLALPALGWLLRYLKRSKARAPGQEDTKTEDNAAA